ncbi:MAG: GHKL domain-containing protein [Clostridia bacterium]|nr:GHKL domain-containing protein [Clostridia bacterium]
MFASEILTISILSAIRELPTDIYKTNFTSFVLATIISKILYFIITQIFSLFIRKSSLQSFNNGYFVPLFIFPVLTLVTSALFLFITFDVRLSAGYQITIFVVNLLLIFYCIFVFIYFQSLSEKERKITELEAERKMNDMNATYLEILEHQNDEFQIVFHDMKNHYLTLSQMENIGDVKQYINELYPSLENQNKVRISKNKIIDLILNKYIVVCKNRNIKFYYEVRTADLNYINDIELSVILNNALDNAVEAAENSVDKIIEFSIRHINNMDFVSIINSCDEKPVSRDSILKTTKNHMQKHGFGSKIIERYTKANNGEYEWFYDETEKRFHLSLMFQSK